MTLRIRSINIWQKTLLINYNVKITHIRHLIYHTFDFVNESSKLNINLVLSFHDFYYVCPTIHLIDNKGKLLQGSMQSF